MFFGDILVNKFLVGLLMITGLMAVSAASYADGNAAKGKRVWARCRTCHTLDVGKNRQGPSLAGMLGRKAGSLEGYRYSPAMKAANIVWNAETLTGYLTAPKHYLPGNKMLFAGLKKPGQIADLIAYLKANGAEQTSD